jgi:hypothetical protein
MKTNVGTLDRVLRIGLGIALLAWMLTGEGVARWWGAIGLVPLVTGMLGFCPLYRLLGLRTCPLARNSG